MRLPDPQRSYAVLIGTSMYQSTELADLPAVANNLDGLVKILTDPALGGLPAERCIVLRDPPDVATVYRTLRRYAATTEDTLLVYFAGHGRISLVRNELYLSLTGTDPDELSITGLRFDLIREAFADSCAVNRVLILDCCFSGRAIPHMSGSDEAILGQVGIEGSYTLTATADNEVALAPAGAEHTAFTGELLSLIRTGIPDGPELLTYTAIFPQLLQRMTLRAFPRPRQCGTGTVGQLALARNLRYVSQQHPSYPEMPSTASAGADLPTDLGGLTQRVTPKPQKSAWMYGVIWVAGTLLGFYALFYPLIVLLFQLDSSVSTPPQWFHVVSLVLLLAAIVAFFLVFSEGLRSGTISVWVTLVFMASIVGDVNAVVYTLHSLGVIDASSLAKLLD